MRVSDLGEVQRRVVQTRAERGFTQDPLQMFLLLSEEIGEIAGELKRTWSLNYAGFDREALADEVCDAFVMLVALADHYGIDVATAVESKFFGKDGQREWKTARDRQDAGGPEG
jgi:NTP pyrophosphatase (non-canonical NTP hydrolase)